MGEIEDIRKDFSVFLDMVYNYMNRTIGVRFINSSSDLEGTWEDAQFELSAMYQYEGVNVHIWDYYLVFCCNFNEEDLDNRLRFKIESDRFCCRKYFIFGLSQKTFTKDKLIERLFPLVDSSKPIYIIKAETILEKFDPKIRDLVPPSFFTEELDPSDAEALLNNLISKIEDNNDR